MIDFWSFFTTQEYKYSWPSFSSRNPFSSWKSKAKDIHLQLRFSKRLILNKTEPLFHGFI